MVDPKAEATGSYAGFGAYPGYAGWGGYGAGYGHGYRGYGTGYGYGAGYGHGYGYGAGYPFAGYGTRFVAQKKEWLTNALYRRFIYFLFSKIC